MLEKVNYTKNGNIIDLNSYYPIYAITIKGTNNIKISDKIDFEEKTFAYCTSNNNIITIDNCNLINPEWKIRKSNRELEETKYLKKI